MQRLLHCAVQVLWHTSGAKRAGVLSTGPGSFWRRHIADDLSHFRLMHLMVAGGNLGGTAAVPPPPWSLRGCSFSAPCTGSQPNITRH